MRPSFFFAVNVIASLVYTAPSLRWNPFIRTDGVLSLTHSLYCERMLSGCPLRAVCKLVPQSLVTPVGILISQIRLTLAKQYHTFDPLAPFVVAFTCGVSKCQVPRDCCVSPSPEGDDYVTANNLQQQSAFSHRIFPLVRAFLLRSFVRVGGGLGPPFISPRIQVRSVRSSLNALSSNIIKASWKEWRVRLHFVYFLLLGTIAV